MGPLPNFQHLVSGPRVLSFACAVHTGEVWHIIAFQESLFTLSSSLRLYDYVASDHATATQAATVHSPLTPALGLQIGARATPHCEGMGGLFICESGESKRVFLLTAWHVVIPPDAEHNQLYAHTTCQHPVSLVKMSSSLAEKCLRMYSRPLKTGSC
jgi:hypothetical protein